MRITLDQKSRSRWVAIATGAVSVLIGLLYLAVITVLDARGPMLPPPPEALVGEVSVPAWIAAVVPQPVESPFRGIVSASSPVD